MAFSPSPSPSDSLSSAGASTEPLPASDDQHLDARPPSGKEMAGGEESDSSLTEQSSSEGEEGGRKRRKERGEETPRGVKEEDSAGDSQEEEEEEEETPDGKRGKKQLRRDPLPRNGNGRKGREEEEDEDDDDEEVLPKPSTRYPMAPERFPSPSPSLSDLEDDVEEAQVESASRGRGRGRGRGLGARGRIRRGALPRRTPGQQRRARLARFKSSNASEELSEEEGEEKKEEEEIRAGASGSTSGRASRSRSSSSYGSHADAHADAEAQATADAEASGSHSPSSSSRPLTKKRPRSSSLTLSTHEALEGLVDLAAPEAGLIELSTEPKTLADELEKIKGGEEREVAMEVEEEREEREEREEEKKEEEARERERKRKKAGKRGKGKEKAIEVEDEEEGETPAGSEHEAEVEEDTSDDAFVRKRADAMEALTKIEIEFARLRDKLYLERMAEVDKERIGVEKGTHPELLHLTQLIELRRTTKIELARKWLEGLEGDYERRRISEEHTAWNWWTNGRADLRTTMLDEANSKRRKLDREKRFIERPKEGGLTPLLAPRPLPQVPLQHRRRVGYEVEMMQENEFAWSLRHQDLRADASVSGLDDDTAWTDLERMGLREAVRHPNVYPFDPAYGHTAPGMGPLAFGPDIRAANPLAAPFGYNGSGYEATGLALQQQQQQHQQQQQQHHFSQSLPSLPPLPPPRVDYSSLEPSRPLSNPRALNYPPKEPSGGHSRSHSGATAIRGFPSNHFATSYADLEAERIHAQSAWQKHSAPTQYPFDDARRAPPPAESLDLVAEHHPRRSVDESHLAENGKSRLTLDSHMATTRSPKAATVAHKVELGRKSPSFMSIPAFVPHHSQHAQSVLHPPVLPHTTPSVVAPTPAPVVKAPVTLFPPPATAEAFPHFGHGLPELPAQNGAVQAAQKAGG